VQDITTIEEVEDLVLGLLRSGADEDALTSRQ
jgi:hypothetical protein